MPRSLVHSLAVVSLLATSWIGAVACAEATPPDDALVATLSSDEIVALCDELRDAVSDQPAACEGGRNLQWIVSSNQVCRNFDRSDCDTTVGTIRDLHETARRDPCAPAPLNYTDDVTSDLSEPLRSIGSELSPTCGPLVYQTLWIEERGCGSDELSSLQVFDGVYRLNSADVPPQLYCGRTLPTLLDTSAPLFVLVSTRASGVPEVILKSCQTVDDCQELARELRELGDTTEASGDAYRYDHFSTCGLASIQPTLLSRLPDDAAPCERRWLPSASITLSESTLFLTVNSVAPAEVSRGCGYVVLSSFEEPDYCSAAANYRAAFEAPLP